jgi:RimJ/RimL family protein N-acetyltransferase
MPVPEVLTERLHLRAWDPDRTADLAVLQADPEVMRFIGAGPVDSTRTDELVAEWTARWERDGYSVWATCDRATGACIGRTGVTRHPYWEDPEVGWLLARPFWGRGLATEGGLASLRFGFETVGLDRIISVCRPENHASERVMRKLGMTHARDDVHPRLGVTVRIYAIERECWLRPGRAAAALTPS